MLIKIIVILLLIVILYCLGSGLVYLARDGGHSIKLARALTWRVMLTLSLFALLMIAYAMGWVAPHMIMVATPT